MNSLILLHDKYHQNSPNKKNKNKDNMDFGFNNNDKFNDFFEKDKKDDNIKINSSFQKTNIPNNIFDLSYMKNKNLLNKGDSNNNIGKYFYSYKKATKRSHYEAFSKDKYEKNVKDEDKVVNLNINNNNYFYINNKIYNAIPDEKYYPDFSKKFKGY